MPHAPEFSGAAISAPHAAAARTGRNMLALGANAIEAAVAMAATLCVITPHANSLCGDAFWLVREPKGRVHYLQACGFAGAGATIKFYRGLGYDHAPPARGPLGALATPGLVDGWRCVLELAKALGGRLPLADLLSDAHGYAREGYCVSPVEARLRPPDFEALQNAPGFAGAFLEKGEGVHVRAAEGDLRAASRIAIILEQLGHAGLRDFYRGDIGRELAADLTDIEAPITRADIERTEARWRAPLNLAIPGAMTWGAPPPTQGLAGLVLQGILQRLETAHKAGFEHIHAIVEASKRAADIRDRVCGDFDRSFEDPAQFLTRAALDREAAAISLSRAAPFAGAPESPQGSTWLGAIDASGLAVSCVQSIGSEFGSGCVLKTTGLLMQDRAAGFCLEADSLHALEPGRQAFHSAHPALAAFDDGRVAVLGAGGGGGETLLQVQAQIFLALASGMLLQEALEAPRFASRCDGREVRLNMEDRFDPSVLSALRRAGQEIEKEIEHSGSFGQAGALMRWPRGGVDGGHDPRGDGAALGF